MSRPSSQAIALLQTLLDDERLIPAKELYNLDDQQLYASALANLAQPLPDGSPSPFSSQSPTDGHALLIAQIVYLQMLLGYALNTKLDLEFIRQFRLLGIEPLPAQYPILEMEFTGDVGTTVPIATEIRSQYNSTLAVYTTRPATIGSAGTVTVPARLNQLGSTGVIRANEFIQMPRTFSRISQAKNTGILSEGRDAEPLNETMIRARSLLQTGRRCVSPRDFSYWAEIYGASKVNVIRGTLTAGNFGDIVTLAVYPEAQTQTVSDGILEVVNDGQSVLGTLADERISVIPAEVIPVTGTIYIRADPHLGRTTVLNRAIQQIQSDINPPYGKWGDPEFQQSLAIAIEKAEGIYSVPQMALSNADTGEPLTTTPAQNQLFEIQASTEIVQL